MTTATNKLSDSQIAELYKFLEKKFVKEYDIQIELVDHLACKIEELMSGEPNISFQSALDKVFSGFGVLGFTNLVMERTRAASKNGRSLWWNEFKQLWKWPEFSKVVAISGMLYLLHLGILPAAVGMIIMGLAVPVNLATLIVNNPRKKLLVGLKFTHAVFGFSGGFSVNIIFQLWLNRIWINESAQSYPLIVYTAYLIFVLLELALVKVHLKMVKIYKVHYPPAFG